MPIRTTREKERDFMASRMPILVDATQEDLIGVDEDLKRLESLMIKNTPKNREKAFWNDSIATSFTAITGSVIVGDGPRVRCKNEKALEVIKEWNRSINVKRQTVEDWIEDTWFDLIVHGNFYWRTALLPKYYQNADLQRLDPKSIEIREDPVYGWRKFIQHLDKYKHYKTKKSFYRNAGAEDKIGLGNHVKKQVYAWNYNPDKKNYGVGPQTFENSFLPNEVHIPDEPHAIVFGSFFRKPPIATALHYIVYKKWITWFMRKYSQKYWAPFILAMIGDPKSNTFPTDPHKMQTAITKVSNTLKQMTNFGYLAVPGDVQVKSLETGTAKSAEIYPMYIRELDKQIMYAIFGSMGQREASGNELATSRILETGWLRFVKGIRRKYELVLTNFYANALLPYHNISGMKQTDIEIDWSPLRFESSEELMRSIESGFKIGLWKDKNEMRKAAQAVFSFIEEVQESENEKVKVPQPTQQGNAIGAVPSPKK